VDDGRTERERTRFGRFAFFLLSSAAIAFVFQALMTQWSVRRSELGLGIERKSMAIPLAFARVSGCQSCAE